MAGGPSDEFGPSGFGPSGEEAHFEGARAASAASYRAALACRDTLLGDAFMTIGPASHHWRALEQRLIQAGDDCRQKYAVLQRATDAVRISDGLVVAAFLGFAMLEAPINKFMFDIVLKSNNLESYLVSLMVTGAMLGLAHVAGTQVRQMRGAFEDRFYPGKLVAAAIILALLALCVGTLTVGRASYAAAGSAPDGLAIFRHVTAQVQDMGLWPALAAALSDRAALILATLNVTGIACAFFLAYVTHDSDLFYQAALNEAARARRSFARTARRFEKRIGKLGRRFAPKLATLSAAHGMQNARVIALKRSRNAELTDDDRDDLDRADARLREARACIGGRFAHEAIALRVHRDGPTYLAQDTQPERPLPMRFSPENLMPLPRGPREPR